MDIEDDSPLPYPVLGLFGVLKIAFQSAPFHIALSSSESPLREPSAIANGTKVDALPQKIATKTVPAHPGIYLFCL